MNKKLQSWKAIARYFDCSERTVRRWEANEGMPVHRHSHIRGARIAAYQHELDIWFESKSSKSNELVSLNKSTYKVAILPFELRDAATEQSYIRDALCEDIISDLASLQSFTVISYSSMKYLPTDDEKRKATIEQMNLNFFIEGSIRLDKEQITLKLRLINATTHSVQWSKSYSETRSSYEALRERSTADIVSCLAISDVEGEFLSQSHNRIFNQSAWEYLHQARQESMRWQPESIKKALELLHCAQHLVGKNGIILANLGRTYLQLREAGIDCSLTPLNKVETILEQLKVDKANEYYTFMLSGWFEYACGKTIKAIESLKLAVYKHNNDPDVLGLLSNCYLISGHARLALPLIRRLQIIDPLTPVSRCLPGWYHIILGEFDAAVVHYERMFEMDTQNDIAKMFLAWVYALNNRYDKQKVLSLQMQNECAPSLAIMLARVFCTEPDQSGRQINLSQEQIETAKTNEMFARFLAFAYAHIGDSDEAILWLNSAVKLGFCAFPFVTRHAPFFKDNIEYQPLKLVLKEMKLQWDRIGEHAGKM
uniref:hypothetical protein n=1 Tax=Ningiella ruwaisensis TaxID=2364274 RepID=UPI00109FC717|nr:hypothetical protein [Ningiella ruwaisensis]